MSIINEQSRVLEYFDKAEMIKKYGYSKKELEKHLDKMFEKWCYDLCLGEEVFITSRDNEHPIKLSECNPYVTIRSGEFALLMTHEMLKLNHEVMAFISVKFTYKKQGLINISGFHVDPNYKGQIIFSVYNAGPNDIVLRYKDPVFMIFFQELQSKKELLGDKSREGYDHIPTGMVAELKGQSITLADNHQKIEKLEHAIKLYGSIAVAIMGSLFAGLIVALITMGS